MSAGVRYWIVQVDAPRRWKAQLKVWDYARAVALAAALVESGVATTTTVGYYRKSSVMPFFPPRFVGLVSFTNVVGEVMAVEPGEVVVDAD